MQELMCFSAFLYQYIESIMFLEVARRGGYNPPSPPLNPPLYVVAKLLHSRSWFTLNTLHIQWDSPEPLIITMHRHVASVSAPTCDMCQILTYGYLVYMLTIAYVFEVVKLSTQYHRKLELRL